jgi:hypothetical protein
MSEEQPKTPDSQTNDSSSEETSQESTPSQSTQPLTSAQAKAKSKMGLRLAALGGAIFGMVFGSVVDMFVQGAMESTGYFGPTLDSVLEEQQTNFGSIQAKLAELNASKDEAERTQIQNELDTLLKKQEKIASTMHEELVNSHQQMEKLRADSLAERGSAGGVDIWLKTGESISVGSRQNVFSFNGVDGYKRAKVNHSGKKHTLTPGDFVEVPVADEIWKVFYKQVSSEGDKNRAGFDVVSPED